jgi:hypothetical protein
MSAEMFESEVRSSGDLAGVFESDDETGYFYLYIARTGSTRIIDTLHIWSGDMDLEQKDVAVRWNDREDRVGLFIRGVLWGVYNVATGTKHGGNYTKRGIPEIPPGEGFSN